MTDIAREKDHRWRQRWMDRSREETLDPRGREMGLDVGHYSGSTPGRRCSLLRLDAWRSSSTRWSYQRSHLIFIFFINRVLFLWSASCCWIICRSCFFFSLLESQIPHLLKFLFLFFFLPPVLDRSLSSAHLYFLFFVFL